MGKWGLIKAISKNQRLLKWEVVMTNKEKLYKEASDLISDILKLELGVGDIVEDIFSKRKKRIIQSWGGSGGYRLNDGNITLGEHLELKQRKITLPMVLEAMKEKEVNWSILPSTDNDIDFVKIIPDGWEYSADWQLHKDNRDCSLFNQKNETVKFIIEALK